MKKLSLYWKCQLIGWSVFTVVAFVFNALIWPKDVFVFIPFAISIFILGLVASHLMKITIKKFRILKKKFSTQVIRLAIISIVFSLVGTFVWMTIMIEAGFWIIEGATEAERISQFWRNEYFFNLFPVLLTFSGWLLIYFLFHYVIGVRNEERLRIHYEVQTVELEAKALRAQMNPHFIFNCLNSIKSLIQDDKKDKSVSYLTIFSKLIRTLFNNADKKVITLYDEIETCKLYLQLEAMRFDDKFSYSVNVDETIDMKSFYVPALIIQPFIENAIWHGIIPKKSNGSIALNVTRHNKHLEIAVDDNGIGREAAKQNENKTSIGHQSKGMGLTQSRLELDNLLQQRQANLEIIDKKDEDGKVCGTKIILSLPQQD